MCVCIYIYIYIYIYIRDPKNVNKQCVISLIYTQTLLIHEFRQVNSKQAFCCVVAWIAYHQDKVHNIPFFRYYTVMKMEGSLASYQFLFGCLE